MIEILELSNGTNHLWIKNTPRTKGYDTDATITTRAELKQFIENCKNGVFDHLVEDV